MPSRLGYLLYDIVLETQAFGVIYGELLKLVWQGKALSTPDAGG